MTRLGGLRPRVTLLIVGVVVVCVGIAFAAVYAGTARELSARSRHDVRSDMDVLAQAVSRGSPEPEAVAARARAYLAHAPFRPTSHVLFVSPTRGRTITNQPELLGLVTGDDRESAAQQAHENRAGRAFLTAPPRLSS